ncbi:MAG: NYN domain-containing protein [Gemmatimonadetes bacterium]|nr:NYN domain-containing protein [Gemmatimonadota bacterium]
MAALEHGGVVVSMGRFKRKDRVGSLRDVRLRLPWSRRWFQLPVPGVQLSWRTHEEKETDVAIACAMLAGLARGDSDAVVLVTGDSDIAPAIRTAKVLFPAAQVAVAFPFDRHNRTLAAAADRSIRLSAQSYAKHQLPVVIRTPEGDVCCPPAWTPT